MRLSRVSTQTSKFAPPRTEATPQSATEMSSTARNPERAIGLEQIQARRCCRVVFSGKDQRDRKSNDYIEALYGNLCRNHEVIAPYAVIALVSCPCALPDFLILTSATARRNRADISRQAGLATRWRVADRRTPATALRGRTRHTAMPLETRRSC